MFRSEEQRPNNAQFAVRVAVLSGIALVVFAAVFFRLWYLQVLSGDEYLAQSKDNQVRDDPDPGAARRDPRQQGQDAGREPDRGLAPGPPRPAARRARRPRNEVLQGARQGRGHALREDQEADPRADQDPAREPGDARSRTSTASSSSTSRSARTSSPVSPPARSRSAATRRGRLAAHLFGYVSEVSEEQLKEPQYQDLDPGDRVGTDGLELQYDDVLRGKNGSYRVQVDAMGTPQENQLAEIPPVTGNNLVLSLDSKVQKAGEDALASHRPARRLRRDAHQRRRDRRDGLLPDLRSRRLHASGRDRPVRGALRRTPPSRSTTAPPPASIRPARPSSRSPRRRRSTRACSGSTRSIVDDGSYDLGGGLEVTNSGGGGLRLDHRPAGAAVLLERLLRHGRRPARERDRRGPAEVGRRSRDRLADRRSTCPARREGLLPTPEWRNELYDEGLTDRAWSVGDNINLALGQGDLQADPLQMAVAYAAIANGGTVVRPHLAESVEDPAGAPVTEFEPAARRQLDIPEDVRARRSSPACMTRRPAPAAPRSRSSAASRSRSRARPAPPSGRRTGTSPGTRRSPPSPTPRSSSSSTVENGGFGAETAAPIARVDLRGLLRRQRDRDDDDRATEIAPPTESTETVVPAG